MFAGEHSIDGAIADGQPAMAVVAISLSAGGLKPLRGLVSGLPLELPAAVVVAQHVHSYTLLPQILARETHLPVTFAASGARLRSGTIYVCPAQQHLIVNPDATLSLSPRERVTYFRPSVDWLFESV